MTGVVAGGNVLGIRASLGKLVLTNHSAIRTIASRGSRKKYRRSSRENVHAF
jgi:hypothetical protein